MNIDYYVKQIILFFFDIYYIMNFFVKREDINEKEAERTFLEELTSLILDE